VTFGECLVAAVKLLPNDSVCVGVEAWSYPNGDTRLVWDVWSDRYHEHFYGSSPESVLAAVQSYLDDKARDAKARIEAVSI